MTTPTSKAAQMQPGSDTFNPAKYVLRIFDDADDKYPQVYFQASTPFPAFSEGNILATLSWSLGLEGRCVVIRRVVHNIWSIKDDVWNETNLYCEFPESKRE